MLKVWTKRRKGRSAIVLNMAGNQAEKIKKG
jgi:hypothetical protein